MSNRYTAGRKAIASCDRCGFRFKLNELRELVVKTKNVNVFVCGECWEEDHPQLQLGMYPVEDPQALFKPRPELGVTQSRDIQWGWNPVGGARDGGVTPNSLVAQGLVESVTVTTT